MRVYNFKSVLVTILFKDGLFITRVLDKSSNKLINECCYNDYDQTFNYLEESYGEVINSIFMD